MPAANVTATATAIVPASQSRNGYFVQNVSDVDIFVGDSSVSAAGGLRLAANGGSISITKSFPGDVSANGALFAIHAATGNKEVRILEL